MRRQRRFAVFAVISCAAMMFSCTAILGVTDVPDFAANDVDGNGQTGDGAGGDVKNDTAVTDADVASGCEVASCTLTFPFASEHSAFGMVSDGGFTLTVASDGGGGSYEMDLGGGITQVTGTGPDYLVDQHVAIRHAHMPFSAFAYNGFYNGYVTTDVCDGGGEELNISALVRTNVTLNVGEDASALGCEKPQLAYNGDGDASLSSAIASQLHVCFTAVPGSPPVSQVAGGVQATAAGILEFQYASDLSEAFNTQACQNDH